MCAEGSTAGPLSFFLGLNNLGQTKVSEADEAVCVDQDVFRLQVAVHHVLLVHVVEGKKQLRCVELGTLLCKAFAFSDAMKMVEELATIDEFHDHINEDKILEGILHFHNKGVIKARQNISLSCTV